MSGANGFLSPNATSWTYAPAGLNEDFSSGYGYLVLVKAVDVATNAQDIFGVDVASFVFTVDKGSPVTDFVRPVDSGDGVSGRYKAALIGQTVNSTQLRGSATDTPAANYAGLKTAQVRLSYLLGTVTYYWNGAAFTDAIAGADAWQGASLSGTGVSRTWDYMIDVAWPAGDREYLVEARAMDDARLYDDTGDGNWSQAPYTGRRFIVDDTPPEVLITTPTELSLDVNTRPAWPATSGPRSASPPPAWRAQNTGTGPCPPGFPPPRPGTSQKRSGLLPGTTPSPIL